VVPSDEVAWAAGTDPSYLRQLASRWRDQFDWRAVERRLNGYDHFLADVGDHQLHFVAVPPVAGHNSVVVPIILNHGWPSAFTEMLPLAERLSNPAAFGYSAEIVFDVVIPSLPGFLFSTLPSGPLTREAIGDDLHELMHDVLGHDRYAVFGGDIGGGAATWMGAKHDANVIGVHLIHPPRPSEVVPPTSADEEAFLTWSEESDRTDGAYSEIMLSRPDTIGAALIDSPTGLLAWIVDKYRDWSDSRGDLSNSFGPDELLEVASLYWFTQSIATSFRQYYDWYRSRPRPPITAPVGVTLSTEPSMRGFPRSLAERACSDLRFWSEPGKGGHFLALEEPDVVAQDIREFFFDNVR
jgi:pimeloyl-ACP methyl ester carboxylesterase